MADQYEPNQNLQRVAKLTMDIICLASSGKRNPSELADALQQIVDVPSSTESSHGLPRLPISSDKLTSKGRKRLKVVTWVLEGHTILEAAGRFRVHRQSISVWMRRFEEHGPSGLSDHPSGPRRRWRATPEVLQIVRQIHELHPEWSQRRIALELRKNGKKLSPTTVWRIIRKPP